MLFLKRSLKAKVTCGWKAQAVFETAMDVKKHTSLSFLEKNHRTRATNMVGKDANTQDLNHQPVFESMINSSGRDSDLSLFIVVCNQICAQARCNSTFADTFKHLIWLLEVFMPRARLRKHLVMNRWSLDSGAWIPVLSKSKKCLWFLPFTPGSPSPPAICFWISLAATVSGAGNCVTTNRFGTHVGHPFGTIHQQHQRQLTSAFRSVYPLASIFSLQIHQTTSHDLLATFEIVKHQSNQIYISQQQSIVSPLPKSVIRGFLPNKIIQSGAPWFQLDLV